MTEREIQEQIVSVLKLKNLLFCHPPNEGKRSVRAGAALKKSGMKKGVPDLLIFNTTACGFKGLALEVKKEKGRLTLEQRAWIDLLRGEGWRAEVGKGIVECIA